MDFIFASLLHKFHLFCFSNSVAYYLPAINLMNMTRILLGFQLVTTSFIHLICCGFPLLISLSGGLSVFMTLQRITPMLGLVQLLVFGFTLYQLYKSGSRATKRQRILFWTFSLVALVFFIYPPIHWFKSDEAKLKQAQMERFFKINHK